MTKRAYLLLIGVCIGAVGMKIVDATPWVWKANAQAVPSPTWMPAGATISSSTPNQMTFGMWVIHEDSRRLQFCSVGGDYNSNKVACGPLSEQVPPLE
jgi:hypothetical protein